MAKVLARSENDALRTELEETYRHLCDRNPKDRVEIINGKVVVSPLPTTHHEKIVGRLIRLMLPAINEDEWDFSTNLGLFLGTQRDRYRPDFMVYPIDAPIWGNDHVYGDATLLVAEVVSKSSVDDDHRFKPRNCAAAGVPLYLVIDRFAGTLRLLSKPDAQTEKYEQQVEVPFGKTLELPEPWNLALDTAKLAD
jgi:Uma2 family endonuclease